MAEYSMYVKFTPVGEYIRILVLKRLANQGPAGVGEIDRMVKEAVETLGVRYDWRIWPRLLSREVEIKDEVVKITSFGMWILEQTGDEVENYVRKFLGVTL
jgi:hypothetical protein